MHAISFKTNQDIDKIVSQMTDQTTHWDQTYKKLMDRIIRVFT